jgi:hypothetical protein
MRRCAFVAAVLVGCYSPLPPRGAPCDDKNPCPTGQSCRAGFCDGGGGIHDASMDDSSSPDTSGNADIDGDGVPNTTDNCPMFSNPGQGNEDGDMLGDGCDPCPIEAVNPPVDPDMDGVSDSCDPRPTMPGDSITVFEGFHNGVPANWQLLGTATQSGDDINLTSTGDGALAPPGAAPVNGVVSIKATINNTLGNQDAVLAVFTPANLVDAGVFCELYSPDAGSTNNRTLELYKPPDMNAFSSKQYTWQTNIPYVLKTRRANTSYTCTVTPNGGAADTVTGNSNVNPANSVAGMYMYGASVNIAWLMVVTSN